MARAQRLLDLLQLLRRHRQAVTGAAIADELGISLRTLYRDIAALQARGAYIDGAPGLGYVLREGFVLPPLMFTADELEALALGSRWVARRGDARLAASARDALAKIAAVLPASLRLELDSNALLVGAPQADAPTAADLGELRAAIRHEQVLVLRYRDLAGQDTERRVWPFALGYFDRVQVLAAWCELRQDMRHFRCDRILASRPGGGRYPRRRADLLRDWRQTHGPRGD